MTKKKKQSSKTKSGTLTDVDKHLSNTSDECQESDGIPNTDNNALITKDVVSKPKKIDDCTEENSLSSSLQSILLKDSINPKVTDKERANNEGKKEGESTPVRITTPQKRLSEAVIISRKRTKLYRQEAAYFRKAIDIGEIRSDELTAVQKLRLKGYDNNKKKQMKKLRKRKERQQKQLSRIKVEKYKTKQYNRSLPF